ncbi:MAG TPA: DUF1697 domain-containing protein, partial [Gallionella sp.]|nr:DUF1697 domain-containing protein [Gallionella sp.]
MTTLIALLRGINIGGNHKLPMKELAALLTDMGLRDVRTYIQSGNVVFRCDVKDKAALAEKISLAIEARYGFAPQVLLLDADELRNAMENNPYSEAEATPASLSLLFLTETPSHPELKAMETLRTSSERFKLAGKVFYLHAPDGFGRSRLAAQAEKLLGVPATGRNWNTV